MSISGKVSVGIKVSLVSCKFIEGHCRLNPLSFPPKSSTARIGSRDAIRGALRGLALSTKRWPAVDWLKCRCFRPWKALDWRFDAVRVHLPIGDLAYPAIEKALNVQFAGEDTPFSCAFVEKADSERAIGIMTDGARSRRKMPIGREGAEPLIGVDLSISRVTSEEGRGIHEQHFARHPAKVKKGPFKAIEP
jgi:hypothetical protein